MFLLEIWLFNFCYKSKSNIEKFSADIHVRLHHYLGSTKISNYLGITSVLLILSVVNLSVYLFFYDTWSMPLYLSSHTLLHEESKRICTFYLVIIRKLVQSIGKIFKHLLKMFRMWGAAAHKLASCCIIRIKNKPYSHDT